MSLELLFSENSDVLVSGVLSDSLDSLGITNCVATNWSHSRPHPQFFGRARTIRLQEATETDERFHLSLDLLESMNSSEVLLIQGSLTFAYFGEMMGTFASEQSVPAVVVDGLTRDSSKTRDLTVAIFSKGFSPIDIKGRGTVVETDRPIALDGGRVNCAPGDFVFGDSDAVIVVPHEIEGDLIPILEKTIANERAIATALKSGLSAKELRGRFSSF